MPKLLFKNLLFFFIAYKNEWKQHKFPQQKIKRSDFYENKNKKKFNTDGIDSHKTVSKEVSYGKNNSFKYFIGYNDNDIIIIPLFV